MDMGLQGKRAFVSGSTQGIGHAVAQGLLSEGAEVVINGRESDRLERAVEQLELEFPGAAVSGLVADFEDAEQVEGLLAELGAVDILVNNVGLFDLAAFQDITEHEWSRYLDVNVMSGVRLSRHALPHMLDSGWGRIVFIGSESGINVPADMVHYGMTKAAMLALANGLAKLTRGTAVTVNTIVGGPTFSTGVSDVVEQIARAQSVSPADIKAQIASGNQTSLLQRFIEPDEIAHLAVYLASPLSSATNGAALRADGGVLTSTT